MENNNDIEQLIIQEIEKLKKAILYIEESKQFNELYKNKVEEIYLSFILLKTEVTDCIFAVNKNIDAKINDSTALLKKNNTQDFETLNKSNKVILDSFKEEISILEKENGRLKKYVYFTLAVSVLLLIRSF